MTGPSSASSPKKAFHPYYSLSVHPVHIFPGTVKVYRKMLQNNTLVHKSLLLSPAWRLAHRRCSMNTCWMNKTRTLWSNCISINMSKTEVLELVGLRVTLHTERKKNQWGPQRACVYVGYINQRLETPRHKTTSSYAVSDRQKIPSCMPLRLWKLHCTLVRQRE